uniref:Uncharacterized protein n=1 Tax=Aegilops tauschii subsp. strangulata TaxID=200361 RepID=A0A453IN95_AEGTS
MSRDLFLRVVNAVEEADDNFKLRKNCCGKLPFSPLQKCMAAPRILIQMIETTCLNTTVQFAYTLVMVFGPEYLREPNNCWQLEHQEDSQVYSFS